MGTEILGCAASMMSLILWWPQAARVWKFRNDPAQLAGISRLGQLLLVLSGLIWMTYAVLTGSLWVGVSVSTNIPLGLLTLAILSQSRWQECPDATVLAGSPFVALASPVGALV
ncbi:hypothetical protein [Pengzhenrongella frigida]|uniref:Uncharacterized protein n=1 Tax=Pengzhenrongella frigida TaxID=1259133 RepID=A0A4Q5MZQ6_9MICO|nr:hypothetical protein [Cellulomonas sp. HLT2-17]RYV50423.1 hypothetical protein EUA98_13710 [Cellulomonas sp. HLT2-17]